MNRPASLFAFWASFHRHHFGLISSRGLIVLQTCSIAADPACTSSRDPDEAVIKPPTPMQAG